MECFATAAKIEYVAERGQDHWQGPCETLWRGTGDCEDQALYLHRLLQVHGHPAEVVFGRANFAEPQPGAMHAWVEMSVAGEPYILDPAVGVIIRRRSIGPTSYVPVWGDPTITLRLLEYESRTFHSGVSPPYEALWAQ
jgi:transglutaminase-like putative cysteine protease